MLSADEERRLIAAAKAGDSDATARLLEAYEPLAQRTIKRYGAPHVDNEDALQAARIGMIDALRRFDPERGTRFGTLAVHHIRAAVQRQNDGMHPAMAVPTRHATDGYSRPKPWHAEARSAAHRAAGVLDLDAAITAGLEPADGATPEELACDPSVMVRRAAAQILDPLDQAIVFGRLAGYTLEQLAREHGLTRERIRQREARAIERLREHLAARGGAFDAAPSLDPA